MNSRKAFVQIKIYLLSMVAILGIHISVGCVNTVGQHQLARSQTQQYTMPDSLPGAWERYKPGSINSLIAKETPQLLEEKPGFYLLPDEVPFRIKAIYLGKEREVDPVKLGFYQIWESMFSKRQLADKYKKEVLVRENSQEYWLPVQEPTLNIIRNKFAPGEDIILYILWPGCNIWNKNIEWFFFVTEYQFVGEDYYNNGNTSSKLGDYQQAIRDYDRAIELDPKYADAYYNRGIAYGKVGEHGHAITDFNMFIELNPKDKNTYFNRGIAYSSLGSYQEAITDYDMVIEIDPKDVPAYSNRGLVHSKNNDYQKAIKDFDKVIELAPKEAFAYYHRGYAYFKLGDHQKAVENLKIAARLGYKEAKEVLRAQGISW